ncbi:MAG: SufD family Fe-S cluster assembly protein [Patescibacteria group bacterium]
MKIITVNSTDQIINIPARSEIFLFDHIGETASPAIEINIAKKARVQYVSICDPAGDFRQSRIINIGEDAQVSAYQAYFGTGNLDIQIKQIMAARAVFNNHVLFYQTGRQELRVQDDYIFSDRGTNGHFLVTGLAENQAAPQYYSELVIKPEAQLTDSRIDMRLYLLSREAKGNLLPSLKIDANEVKARHGASTFQLAPDDLFYLQSRGLTEKQIRRLVISSLAQRFTAGIKDVSARERISQLVEERAAAKK